MPRITLADIKKARKEAKPKKTKYRSVSIVKKEIRFDSKLEATYFEHLEFLKEQKLIKFYLRQVPFHLPGNIKYLVDFIVFYPDGVIRYIDIKGVMTQVSLNKIKQVVDLYPVNIEILTMKDLENLGII